MPRVRPTPSSPLTDAAIWRFTFYWTLILFLGTFLACAALASANIILSRAVFAPGHDKDKRGEEVEMRPISSSSGGGLFARAASAASSVVRRRQRTRRRPPLYLVLIIPLLMGAIAAFVALVSGTVVGFALAAVYSSGGFSMSTWVPFMWALIQVVVLIISWVCCGCRADWPRSYSSLTRIL